MKNLYGSISVNKCIEYSKKILTENIKYYKLKNEKYGLEIIKKGNKNDEKIEIKNITNNEQQINNLLDILVIKQITPNSLDVIEDLVKIYVG